MYSHSRNQTGPSGCTYRWLAVAATKTSLPGKWITTDIPAYFSHSSTKVKVDIKGLEGEITLDNFKKSFDDKVKGIKK